jgi:glycosyltransferase involved in cell wall biosynthesis
MDDLDLQVKKFAKYLEVEWRKVRWPTFKTWNGKFTKPVTKEYKISICTTAMNRLSDIQQTLEKNIIDNLDYPRVEFVLLDYNSSDGLEQWVNKNLMKYIASEKLVYFRTEKPKYYSMAHSRNVAFKAASGDIVNNVDGDCFTNAGFATFINRMANEQPEKAIFAKSKQLLRGRLGFFKKEFIELLGGYDEGLIGYGHDDQDLLNRAWELGFRMMPFRGTYSAGVKVHRKHLTDNFEEKTWWLTEGRNRLLSYANIIAGKLKANEGKHWGKATLIRNWNADKIRV